MVLDRTDSQFSTVHPIPKELNSTISAGELITV